MTAKMATNNFSGVQKYNLARGELESILSKARVPEHSVFFMQAMSDGEAFLIDHYLFIHADKLTLAIGYPLLGEYCPEQFYQAINLALDYTNSRDCLVICPSLPEQLKPYSREQDYYYVLPVNLKIPVRLDRLSNRAALTLRIEESSIFTKAHGRLWAEFVARTPLAPNVRRLYERTEKVIGLNSNLLLLNAWDENGNLAACLLLDMAPGEFLSYIVGAHSRTHYTPYASDLLFQKMISIAHREGKKYIHLGLGVNEGIRRFKTKWGGMPTIKYEMAAWHDSSRISGQEVFQMLAPAPGQAMSQQEFIDYIKNNKEYKMIWEVEKDGCRSWIGGTAHIFGYSFETSLRNLLEQVETVIFEGPLDQISMEQVVEVGNKLEPGTPCLLEALSHEEIKRLERKVYGPRGLWARLLQLEYQDAPDVRYLLSQAQPWFAFFSIWNGYLRRKGWNQSVDLEAWQLAREMDKKILGMETIHEQIETLQRTPFERIVKYFQACHRWDTFPKRYEHAYLYGDIDRLMEIIADFPSRTEQVVNRRDQIFLERMLPYIQKGNCAIFVGASHMNNLRRMIAEVGFSIRKCNGDFAKHVIG